MSQDPCSVLFLGANYRPERTGNAPYTSALAESLARRGYRVRALTTHPHYPAWQIDAGYGQWQRREVVNGVELERLKHYVPSRPTGIKRLVSEITYGLRVVLSRWRGADVIIAPSPALFATLLAASRARLFHRRTPLIIWVQDLYSLGITETAQGGRHTVAIIRAAEGWALKRATRIVSIHPRFAAYMHESLGIDTGRIEIIRNWSHIPTPAQRSSIEARREFGWPVDVIIALHAGNMGVKQGLENVIDAARLADSRSSPVLFILLGDGAERQNLLRRAESIERLRFIDPLPDDQYLLALQAADVLILNERVGVSEMAVPSKLTSYFASGRPVVAATAADGITASEVNAAGAGPVIPAGIPSALLDEIENLGADPERASELGQSGARYRENFLRPEAAVQSFSLLIEELRQRPSSVR